MTRRSDEAPEITQEYIKARLGRFSKFAHLELRHGQKMAMLRYHFFCKSDRKFFFLNAPPGSGKSLLGMLLLPEGRGAYLCSSKFLQDQILHDFPEARLLKGRSNYRCRRHKFLTCDVCPKTGSENGAKSEKKAPVKKCPDCPYEIAKREAQNASFCILNYSYFFAEANYIGTFSDRETIVCDEADLAENQLLGAVEITIRKSWAEKYNLPMPLHSTTSTDKGVLVWIDWARRLVVMLEPEVKRLKARVHDMANDDTLKDEDAAKEFARSTKELRQLEGTVKKLQLFTSWADKTWIFQEDKYSFSFKPTWLTGDMMEMYLGQHCNTAIFMSGTLHPPMVAPKLLGIEVTDSDYMEVPSTFPASQRPIYMRAVVDMTAKTWKDQMSVLCDNIKRILDVNKGEKGIVHAVSYQLANAIVDGVGSSRLMTHAPDNKEQAIEEFIKSPAGTALVSPSIIRGVDLKDDLCRFIIFPKCPFLTLGDKVTNARSHAGQFGNMWYKSEAAQQIVQGSCRGMRHEGDSARTYILDKKAIDLYLENVQLFPLWFREAVIFV